MFRKPLAEYDIFNLCAAAVGVYVFLQVMTALMRDIAMPAVAAATGYVNIAAHSISLGHQSIAYGQAISEVIAAAMMFGLALAVLAGIGWFFPRRKLHSGNS